MEKGANMKLTKLSGFSLIELLVVTAVIGVLALLIFGATQRSVASARQAQGTANVRQWVLAFTMYADDYRGRFPSEGQTGAGVDMTNSAAWFNVLPPYVGQIELRHTINPPSHTNAPGYGRYPRPGDKNMFMCPSMRRQDLLQPPPANEAVFAYGYNLWIEHNQQAPLRWQNIEHFASRFAVIGERGANETNPSSSKFANMDQRHIVYRHRGARETIVGFADGHVESLSSDALEKVIWNPQNR
jgi:prepilin-type N-terminal cleavage/methylation domain-containing protein/prepilin-type processing-associated H-X9-DG protein